MAAAAATDLCMHSAQTVVHMSHKLGPEWHEHDHEAAAVISAHLEGCSTSGVGVHACARCLAGTADGFTAACKQLADGASKQRLLLVETDTV
jgi:hypothetical protein